MIKHKLPSIFNRSIRIISVAVLLTFFFIIPRSVSSFSCEDSCSEKSGNDKLACLEEVRADCERKLSETSAIKQTLSGTIAEINGQIAYTQSEINKTAYQIEQIQAEIDGLSGKISTLDLSLDQITQLLTNRIKESYKISKVNPVYLLLTSKGFQEFVTKYKYLQVTEHNDRLALYELEEARLNYDNQRDIKEDKQAQVLGLQDELLAQKSTLSSQQSEKQILLNATKNDEQRFQELLSKAQAELLAIQAIVAGKGDESEIRDVNAGDRIASIIPSASACSSGAHLHFEVAKNGVNQNPAGFLSSTSLQYNYNTDEIPEFVNPSGSWPWPIDSPIVISQIYGNTFWTQYLHYNFHTGIDMLKQGDSGASIKAVRKGKLYRGSIACGGGTLRYVRVQHAEDDYDTYYLHVNYF